MGRNRLPNFTLLWCTDDFFGNHWIRSVIQTLGSKCICILVNLSGFLWHFFSIDLSWPLCRVRLAAVLSSFSTVNLAYILMSFPWFWHLDLIFFSIDWLPFILFWLWRKIVWKADDSNARFSCVAKRHLHVFYTLPRSLKISFNFVYLVSICCKRNLYQN